MNIPKEGSPDWIQQQLQNMQQQQGPSPESVVVGHLVGVPMLQFRDKLAIALLQNKELITAATFRWAFYTADAALKYRATISKDAPKDLRAVYEKVKKHIDASIGEVK